MSDALVPNPLTVAVLEREGGEPSVLDLRAFAQRRSFKINRIERGAEPVVFAALLEWLEGRGDALLQALPFEMRMELWRKGLLISPIEHAATPPGARPGFSDGHQIAAALCPQAARLLRDGPQVPPLPARSDRGLLAGNYCMVPPVIGPDDVAALNAFYDVLRERDWLELSARGSTRYVIHNDPVARRVHWALTPYFSALTGEQLKPSYSFASDYCEGSPLPQHVDRPQCEVTFSLYLNYWPEPESDLCPWPLVVHPPEGEIPAYQQRGGGVALRGRVLPHSRPPLPAGHKARLLFLHYVLDSFEGSLN